MVAFLKKWWLVLLGLLAAAVAAVVKLKLKIKWPGEIASTPEPAGLPAPTPDAGVQVGQAEGQAAVVQQQAVTVAAEKVETLKDVAKVEDGKARRSALADLANKS